MSAFLLLVFCTVLFNYLFFIAYVGGKKGEFRQALLHANVKIFEKKEILKTDLYKNKGSIVWHEHNKEISVNGVFYEVVKTEEKSNFIVLYIIKDKKENDLFASFFSSQNQSEKNGTLFNFVKLFFGLNYLKTPGLNIAFKNDLSKEAPLYKAILMDSQYAFKRVKPPCFLTV